MQALLLGILEIIKIAIPAFIVYWTVQSLLKNYLDKQYQLRVLEGQQAQKGTTLPMRFQSYERLSLFCERISIPNLILRLRSGDMNVKNLRITMLLAIQQEYEHNITQQIYVSDQLWKIITMARDHTVTTINGVASSLDENASAKVLADTLFEYLNGQEGDPLQTALLAIKKETASLL